MTSRLPRLNELVAAAVARIVQLPEEEKVKTPVEAPTVHPVAPALNTA